MKYATLSLLAAAPLLAGPYSPQAGQPGSNAVPHDDPAFIAWADGWQDYVAGADVTVNFQTPAKALGPALEDDVYGIVCLGREGSIVLTFSQPIGDGEGPDFAVFENGFRNSFLSELAFLELAFVEVSSDGEHFVRFPTHALAPDPIGAFGWVDASDFHGFAGTFVLGFGTPFDLADLPDDPNLDKQDVRYVRLIDISGDGSTLDSQGNPIYDPYRTVGSAGFDLDAVGVLNGPAVELEAVELQLVAGDDGSYTLVWQGLEGATYAVEQSTDLQVWTALETLTGTAGENRLPVTPASQGAAFFRVKTIAQ
ncbi:MAG: PEP-CTERM sorting domain-containing protein [Verrucomicrobiota bacterium JB022]|nr:PEP-CTERM sorting domain-containing protein [Verrucomicrobiota bacterium JB022]